MTNKSAKPEIVGAFLPLHEHGKRLFIEMPSTENRFVIGPSRIVIGPSRIPFASLYVCTFQPGNFRGRGGGGEGVTALPSCGRSYATHEPELFCSCTIQMKVVIFTHTLGHGSQVPSMLC